MISVRWSDQRSLGWPAGVDQPFEFETGQYIVKAGVAVFVHLGGVVRLQAGGNDDGPDLLNNLLIRHMKIDTALGADLDAFGADRRVMAQAFLGVDQIA